LEKEKMTEPLTLAEVRKKQEAQLGRLRQLQRDLAEADSARRGHFQNDIDALARDIRDLDNILADLIKRRAATK
jgi:hypothetical protein